MNYPNLFAKYQKQGRDWIKALPAEDLKVFIDIGLQANQHGRLGGLSHTREHLQRIGRIGGIVTASWRMWNHLLIQEMEKEGIL